ncbi:hypothetical protein RBSWK_00637 [Rhodopirellula baltica SWK14]|uniref:Uncharacterized protein n=1 Tax=Rhodopirellula baltica SWK14 TaxID=993516 RepID=L7CML0_RHOBT|nr:hypothetical protein RBSWK_00637 [Rhodopirellula baltica SWK14]
MLPGGHAFEMLAKNLQMIAPARNGRRLDGDHAWQNQIHAVARFDLGRQWNDGYLGRGNESGRGKEQVREKATNEHGQSI